MTSRSPASAARSPSTWSTTFPSTSPASPTSGTSTTTPRIRSSDAVRIVLELEYHRLPPARGGTVGLLLFFSVDDEVAVHERTRYPRGAPTARCVESVS